MKELHVVKAKGKRKVLIHLKAENVRENVFEDADGKLIDSQHSLISMFLPPTVKAFYKQMEEELDALCGPRYSRGSEVKRWASQKGSIVLGNQQVAIEKPRVRNLELNKEVPLYTYARFQDPKIFDQAIFEQGLKHVSQRDYEKGLPTISASFGVKKSSVSRRWIKSTKKQVEKLLNRDLRPLKIVAVFIDGKRFSKLGVVIALGVGEDGRKHVLGIYQSSTENSAACLALLNELEKRGLPERGLLFVVDGGSGINKALNEKYEVENPECRRAIRIRCHIHKWNNIRDVLDAKGQAESAPLFWAMRDAKDMGVAKACSDSLETVLKKHNQSALASYDEAKDDLLMIHRLGIGAQLRKFFSTTNPIESLNSLLEEDMRRVKHWQSSEHFQRWTATACLNNEKRMRRIRGFQRLPALVVRLQELCCVEQSLDNKVVAA